MKTPFSFLIAFALVTKINTTSKWIFLPAMFVAILSVYAINSNAQVGNTRFGISTLPNNKTGSYNTAIGYHSLFNSTDGFFNSAIGAFSLYSNKTGNQNTASGYRSLFNNIMGNYNTANGYQSLYKNYNGSYNTANGYLSLFSNITGNFNTANGHQSLFNNTGSYNTANGYQSLYSNTTGQHNTASGYKSLQSNTTGSYNTALGYYAGVTSGALTNATAIGYNAQVDASNKVRIGNTEVTSIGGQVGWTTFSDGRYKKNVKENIPGITFINKLRPVSYIINVKGINEYYNKGKEKIINDVDLENRVTENVDEAVNVELQKGEYVAGKILHSGFIAQEVEEAARMLNFKFDGVDKPENKEGLYGLRYESFIMPLVKAVQELSKMNDEKDTKIDGLQKQIDDLKSVINGSSSKTNVVLTDALLEQNRPNPFSSTTTIGYTLPQKFANAQIVLTDKSGKMLKQITVSGGGKGRVNIDAAALTPGTYNYALIIDNRLISSKQMVLAK